MRETDLVIRLGGDEFVILVEEAPSGHAAEAGIQQVVDRVRQVMTRPFALADGREIEMTAAIGWAVAEEADTPDTLLHRADDAMYADKAAGRGVR